MYFNRILRFSLVIVCIALLLYYYYIQYYYVIFFVFLKLLHQHSQAIALKLVRFQYTERDYVNNESGVQAKCYMSLLDI